MLLSKKLYNARKLLLAIVNICILTFSVWFCIYYLNSIEIKSEKLERENFLQTAVSLRKVANTYIESWQQLCDSLAFYINSRNLTIEEVGDIISGNINFFNISIYVIDYETLDGRIIDKNRDFKRISLAAYKKDFLPLIEDIKKYDTNRTHMTRAFINPKDGDHVVAFCQDIQPLDKGKHLMLMFAVPVSSLKKKWEFPSKYKKAEISLINKEGFFIIRSPSLKRNNLWDFIRFHNDIDDAGMDRIKEDFLSGKRLLREFKNSQGETSYFVCISSKHDSWLFVGHAPKSSVVSGTVDFTLVAVVFFSLLALVFINGYTLISMNRRLSKSIEEAKRANNAKTNFLSSVSHDIRTPLNAIMGMALIAEKNINDSEHVHLCIKKISLACEHLLTLINNVLDISKIESGKFTLNLSEFSLSKSIENLVSINLQLIRAKKLQFKITAENITKEYFLADEVRLNQIFMNILSNAIKYTHEGGSVSININEMPDIGSNNMILEYSVSDTGIGMSEEFQNNMYESFARAVDNRVDKITGSGLGLAIVKEMVALMGGTITCKSILNIGTTFVLRIPLPVVDISHRKFEYPYTELKLLVISSEADFLSNVKNGFELIGLKSEAQTNIYDAASFILSNFYDAVFIDGNLPNYSAENMVRKIRDNSCNKNIKIIICDYFDLTLREAAEESGADDIIIKPVLPSMLYRKISELFPLNEIDEETNGGGNDLKGMKILVAEDNELNWEITKEMLSYFGIETFHAENGQICCEMISKAKEGDYDIILMDIQMPVMNGKQAAIEIRAMESSFAKTIPIIAVTADAFAEDINACMKAGMNGHVAKPINFDSLKETIRQIRKK